MSEAKLQAAQEAIHQCVSVAAPQPHWTAWVSALAVPLVAVAGVWIARKQAKTARNKLKLDLFERRMAVYDTVRETLGAVTRQGCVTPDDEIAYLTGISTAKWLFGDDVATYLDKTLWEKLVNFNLHNTMMSGPPSEERNEHVKRRAETMKWLSTQYQEFDRLCAPYLKLEH